jgi:hypothetical protein
LLLLSPIPAVQMDLITTSIQVPTIDSKLPT